jgi:hypothetical protein
MSRSFVRAWATVATLMAVVCFAFVQPMPEHVAAPDVHQQAHDRTAADPDGIGTATGNYLMTSPPFIDTVLSGKTFTPYLVLSRAPLRPGTDGLAVAPQLALGDARTPPFEPPIRPG